MVGKDGKPASVYAPPHASRRSGLWGKLDELPVEGPWLLIGDFNCVLREVERSSRRGASSSFQAWTENNDLIDLGYEGTAFTWGHGARLTTRKAA